MLRAMREVDNGVPVTRSQGSHHSVEVQTNLEGEVHRVADVIGEGLPAVLTDPRRVLGQRFRAVREGLVRDVPGSFVEDRPDVAFAFHDHRWGK
jgi:hypothetical protein